MGEAVENQAPVYKKKDFVSDQEVRWCPGCGDYTILAAVQLVMPKIGKKKEDIAFVSGIGCSSRLPYYMNNYGLHTIHGRAPAVAMGLKVQNPDLSVWVITGDGDGMSIGGNHLIHAMRRNLDINILLFNNEIYGLTKGQYSPTSAVGLKTKSTPYGSLDYPFNPGSLGIGAGTTFFARTADNNLKHMQEVFLKAAAHKGTSFIEILQNCVIFNDAVHDDVVDKKVRDERTVMLRHGEAAIYGTDDKKCGLIYKNGKFSPAVIGEDGVSESDIYVHDETVEDPTLSFALSRLSYPDSPVPLGVIRAVKKATFEESIHLQLDTVKKTKKPISIGEMLRSTGTWTVK